MRYIIYGAGAIGGTIGARLSQEGLNVVLIARGAHYDAIARDGLHYRNPAQDEFLKIPVVEHPKYLAMSDDDVVFMTMKSQHTDQALQDLSCVADIHTPIVCCQNGVANERMALRYFRNVYAMVVMVGGTHLKAGEVLHHGVKPGGVLDCGKYPHGVDERINTIAVDLTNAGFVSRPHEQSMSFKYTKLMMNLGNGLQALCSGDMGDLYSRAREEAKACLNAANIEHIDLLLEGTEDQNSQKLPAIERQGGSSWQSLARGTGDIETDYLNGEICLLGRLHGVPTPVNETIQNLANQATREGWATGSLSVQEVKAAIETSSL